MTRSRFGRRFLEIYKDHDFLSERLCQAENVAKQFIGEIVDNAVEQIDNENSGIRLREIDSYVSMKKSVNLRREFYRF